jgi:PhnB protein
MPTMPYVHFQGQCAEALAFYAEVFGGSDLQMLRYAEGPEAPAAWKSSDRIMHGQVTIYDGTFMASDYPPGVTGDAQKGVSVMQTAPDAVTGRAAFDRLCAGGAVIEPFGPTFFSPGFGMVKDRFGTHWIISALPAQPQE